MDALLVAARVVHFAAAISLAGAFACECLVAAPALRAAGADGRLADRVRRRLRRLASASLALAVLSSAAWLLAVTADMSGKPLGAALSQGTLGVVLTGTRFGGDWLLRLAGAALLGILLAVRRRQRRADAVLAWAALAVAAAMLASLAWAGHGAATAGSAGELHLAADLLHLVAAGTWLGTLPPFALLLAETARDAHGAAVARAASRRYSILAIASVAALLGGGLVNTWFLAGTVPALIGTQYGRLLLAKIALFALMLVVAAINLRRLTPRLAASDGGGAPRAAGHMRRNAYIEAGLGLAVLAIVGVLGTLPPGLHEEPGWPLPFRLALSELARWQQAMLALAAASFCASGVAVVSTAAAGTYRRTAAAVLVLVFCGAAMGLSLAPAIEPAYPTSFYAPAEPYAAPSVARGAALYDANCVACHGTSGHGDGPAAAGLPVRPADLTEPHLFAHNPGDLFWWISRGRANGAMPGFAAVLAPDQRWDVINFIRARAAGDLTRQVGGAIAEAAAYPVPDFAFERGGAQNTLRRTLLQGPVLLLLYSTPVPVERLHELAEAQQRFSAAGLEVLAVDLGKPPGRPRRDDELMPLVVGVSEDASAALRLFRSKDDGGETELMLDKNGDVRARWTARGPQGLPNADTLIADAADAARFAIAAPSHAGHH